MFSRCIYVYVQSTWWRAWMYYATAGRSDERPGWEWCNKRDTFARLARRRIERTNWKPTRYVSPPIARVVKQSLLLLLRFVRSIRTRTSLGSSLRLSVFFSFRLSIMSKHARKMEEEGRLFRDEDYLRRVLFFISRGKFERVGKNGWRRNLPSTSATCSSWNFASAEKPRVFEKGEDYTFHNFHNWGGTEHLCLSPAERQEGIVG